MDCNSGLGIGQIPDTLMNIPKFELFDTEPYLIISARRFIQVFSCLFRIRKNHVLGRKLGVTKIMA